MTIDDAKTWINYVTEIRFRYSTPSLRFAYAHCCGMTTGYGIIHKVLLLGIRGTAMTRTTTTK